jgi:hypothetical protein
MIGFTLSSAGQWIKHLLDMLEWLGGGFDPEEFDIKFINGRLRQIS